MYNEQFQRELPRLLPSLRERGVVPMLGGSVPFAQDSQPVLTTSPNSGIPAWMTYWVDPDILRILFAPRNAVKIIGDERKTGNWTTTTAVFPIVESAGEVSSYGDYADNGMVSFNSSFPQRQSYHYQVITEFGEREVEMVAQAKINLVSEKKESATTVISMFQNDTYFYGVSGLQNYGLLNDPSLSAPLQPGPKAYASQAHGPWITSGVVTATPNEIYQDIQSLFIQLVSQADGTITIDRNAEIVIAMDPETQVALTAANSFNTQVEDLLRKSFPNIRFEAAVQYTTVAGNLVQMICPMIEGQRTAFCAFTEKLRAHQIVRHLSSWRQKISQGTWGTIIRQPFAISSMLGV